jgi:hypothetical protein
MRQQPEIEADITMNRSTSDVSTSTTCDSIRARWRGREGLLVTADDIRPDWVRQIREEQERAAVAARTGIIILSSSQIKIY